ncbi:MULTISPECIES: DUF1640 domain-containing protein [unclassified Desulfovibrio]|uniref:DUF1640 domain-containing protein n=1 Tax=unclassified Desulfovibrio TaxID=2593640 RepID=UPI0013ED6B48|nr:MULTISPECIES: DUF1640 domain-containing protein [unclassified Desulfovibrio]
MPATTFDTLSYFERLKSAGVPEAQARIQADALRELVDSSLVTKRDLRELEYKLTIRLGGIAVACTALLLAVLPMMIR